MMNLEACPSQPFPWSSPPFDRLRAVSGVERRKRGPTSAPSLRGDAPAPWCGIRRPGAVRDGVFDARLCKGAQAQGATVADAAGRFLALIARPGQFKRRAKLPAAPHDFAFSHGDDRRHDFKLGLGPSPGDDDAVERLVVFGPAVGVAGAILRDGADKNLFRAEHFGT